MSGILCVYNASGISQDGWRYRTALRRLAHRGADGEGTDLRRDLFIGVRRSAIGPGSGGAQPVTAAGGKIIAALDGHIHNREEIRGRLSGRGWRGDLSSDAALVLAAYAEYGEQCVERFDGVWALVLWDERAHRLLLARDPLGVRPLYHYDAPRHLLVASEIKAIIALDPEARAMDHRRVRQLVTEASIDDWTGTCFARIRPVPPGAVLEFRGGGLATRRHWSLGLPSATDAPPDTVLAELVGAVERHTPDDVSVGLALSGGIDSATIAGIVARSSLRAGPGVRAFSIHPPMTTDESFLIDITVRRTGIPHTYVSLDAIDYPGALARVVDFHDEPIQYSGIFYQFELRRCIAEAGCRAVLVGYGADEIFGGYPHLATPFLLDLMARGRMTDAARFVLGARAFLQSPATRIVGDSFRYALARVEVSLRRRIGGTARPAPARPGGRVDTDVLALPEDDAEAHPAASPLDQALRDIDRREIFRRALLDCFRKNIALLVRLEDRNAMAHGLDLCAPFMDVALVRAALTLPSHRYMHGGWNKAVLRAATRDMLAPEVVGYPRKLATPGNDAYVAFDALRDQFRDLLASESFHRSGLWSRRCEELYRQDAARGSRGGLWFRVYMTEQWYQRVVRDGRG